MGNDDASDFKNLLEVLDYLKASQLQVSKSTLYRHREQGKIRAGADGCYAVRDVDKYARDFLRPAGAARRRDKRIDYDQQSKQAADARKVAAQAEHWEIKTKILRGEYIERTAFERALARRAAVFKSDIENFIRTYCAEMISIVKGESIYLPDLTEFWLEQAEIWLGRYAEPEEFEIPAGADLSRLDD